MNNSQGSHHPASPHLPKTKPAGFAWCDCVGQGSECVLRVATWLYTKVSFVVFPCSQKKTLGEKALLITASVFQVHGHSHFWHDVLISPHQCTYHSDASKFPDGIRLVIKIQENLLFAFLCSIESRTLK